MASFNNVFYINPNSVAAMLARLDDAIADNNRALAEHMITKVYAHYDQLAATFVHQARVRIRQIPAHNRHSRPGTDCAPA